MKKTPEEIKKGLECCYSPVEPMLRCEACPYNGSIVCKMRLDTDALTYIQRLEAQNAELVRKTDKLQSSMGQVQKALQDNGFQTLEKLLQAYSQVKRERDAAVACIPRSCGFCKWHELSFNGLTPDHDCKNPEKCLNISGINTGWEWRGVPEKEE